MDLPLVMKLLHNYIAEIGNAINLRKIYRKDQTVVVFNQNQEKDARDNKNMNSNCESQFLHCVKQYHWAEEFPGLED